MKIYIATPVNGRPEATIEEKRKAAYHRVCNLKEKIRIMYPDAELHSSFDFDIAPIKSPFEDMPTESEIMGKCVQRVMECDAIFLDDDFMKSRGCKLERDAALHYDKYFIFSDDMDIRKRLERFR